MEAQKKEYIALPDGRYFDFEDHILYSKDGKILKSNLQGYYYDVLYFLAKNSPSPKSIDDLIESIWRKKTPTLPAGSPDASRVRQVIKGIRDFLEDEKPYQYIISVRPTVYSKGGYQCCLKIQTSELLLNESDTGSFFEDYHVESKVNKTANSPVANERVRLIATALIRQTGITQQQNALLLDQINTIIELLEKHILEEFEEIYEKNWENLNSEKKAEMITEAYVYLNNMVRDISTSSRNI